MYSAFDVSKWCKEHGIQSVYLERRTERIMDVLWVYHHKPQFVVRDALKPGVALKTFVQQGDELINQTRARAEAYMQAVYDTDMKWISCVKAAFPAPGVDLIVEELESLIKVWGLNTYDVPSVKLPKEKVSQIKKDYPVPYAIRVKDRPRPTLERSGS